jgi:hypothetical protein
MELMRHFWDAAAALDPRGDEVDEGKRFPICRPEPLRRLFEAAGLTGVETRAVDVPTVFATSTTTGRRSWEAKRRRRRTACR